MDQKLQDIMGMSKEDIDRLMDEAMQTVDDLDGFVDDVSFKVGDLIYNCQFRDGKLPSGKTVVDYKFVLTNHPKAPKRRNFATDAQFTVASKTYQIGVTGTGHQFSVLSKAMGALKRWVNAHDPDYITFTADEENRQKLYRRMYDRYKSHLPAYELADENPVTGQPLDSEEFWLVKK